MGQRAVWVVGDLHPYTVFYDHPFIRYTDRRELTTLMRARAVM